MPVGPVEPVVPVMPVGPVAPVGPTDTIERIIGCPLVLNVYVDPAVTTGTCI
jgi:hypothetical protein